MDAPKDLRDWFAGQAVTGLAEASATPVEAIAEKAYQIADALLAERAKKLEEKKPEEKKLIGRPTQAVPGPKGARGR